MRAIILAAGRGSRMGKATDRQPKCLTVLAGKSLLQWQLDALRQAGIKKVAVVRGYQSQLLKDSGYVVFDNPRWAETNMVMSLTCAEVWLDSFPCIVSYSDIVYHPRAVEALMKSEGLLSITYDRLWYSLWKERFADPLSDAETFRTGEDGALLEIGERRSTLDSIEGQYMGLLKFRPEGWARVKSFLDKTPPAQKDALDMTGLLRRLLGEGMKINTVPVEGRWCEVDNEKDLSMYERKLQFKGLWAHDWRF